MKRVLLILLCIVAAIVHAAQTGKSQNIREKQIATGLLQEKMWNAVSENNLPALKDLFTQKTIPDINVSERGNTPLFLAIWYKNAEMTQFLIEHQADVAIRNNKGETPLLFVAQQLLIARTQESITRLLDILRQLLAAEADPNAQDAHEKTALEYIVTLFASDYEYRIEDIFKAIRLLVIAGANTEKVNLKNKEWFFTPQFVEHFEKVIKESKAMRAEYLKLQKHAQQEIEQHLIPPLASIVSDYAYNKALPEDVPIKKQAKKRSCVIS